MRLAFESATAAWTENPFILEKHGALLASLVSVFVLGTTLAPISHTLVLAPERQ